MFTQTIALFVDAYRELNARKLFWIVLGLSGLLVLAFAAVGIDDTGLSIFGAHIELPLNTNVMPRADFYKTLLQGMGINIWLTWGATIMALVSTAGIFPDLLSGGALELYLSKPISRLRLFAMKYISGLLFVALQVTIFCLACYLVIGLRAGAWEPGLFWAVPLVLCFFSYLFCICALLGIITRSTIAAALLTLLTWFALFLMSSTDKALIDFTARSRLAQERQERNIVQTDELLASLRHSTAATQPAQVRQIATLQAERDATQAKTDENARSAAWLGKFSRLAYIVRTVMPKTDETIGLMNRVMMDRGNMMTREQRARRREFDDPEMRDRRDDNLQAGVEVANELQHRSVGWVVGTSLLFEAVVLSLGAWIFCRRDG